MKKVFTIFAVLILFFTILACAQKREFEQKVKPKAELIAVTSIGNSLNSVIPQRFGGRKIYNL